jgi:hypothetical protein
MQNKFKVLYSVIGALVVTLILSRAIFWHNTPLINPTFILKTQATFQKAVSWPSRFLASLKARKSENTLPKDLSAVPTIIPEKTIDPTSIASSTVFKPVGDGVSTGTDTATGNKYVRIEAGTVVEVTEYTLIDGRRIQVIKPLD